MAKFDWQHGKILLIAGAVVLALVCVLVFVLLKGGGEKQLGQRIERLYSLEDPRFVHELGVLLGPPFIVGNRYAVLRNGDEIFPPMLAAIRSAKSSITFETYIYWSGDIGRAFADALCERARQGVKVHVLLDWLGSNKLDKSLMQEMVVAGVEVKRFHPPHWSHLHRLNTRTHRKLLVVDGRIGFTGGVGIAPAWTGHGQDPDHWRDTHFKVEGPVVAQMQAAFLDNWVKVTGAVLHGDDYFPPLHSVGTGSAQIFSSSPSGGSANMQLMYLFAITAASRSIDLSAAYFVPDDLTRDALIEAMKRGVKLRVVVPGEHIDSDTVRNASRALWGPLLSAGAVIAEYKPTMFHVKAMIVDDLLVSVGSTNFDNRSFRLNDEATLNILDANFAKEQTAIFETDLTNSHQVTFDEWRARPLRERLGERLASLVANLL